MSLPRRGIQVSKKMRQFGSMPTSLEIGRLDFRAFQQFASCAGHRNEPIHHDVAAVRELEGVVGILLDEKYCQTVLGVEHFDGIKDLPHDQRCQAQRRLVEQKKAWLCHQSAGNRQHLLFAARQRPAALRDSLLQPRKHSQYAIKVRLKCNGSAVVAPICRFSSTVIREKIRRPSGDCASLSFAISCVGRCVMFWPAKSIVPSRARGLPQTVIINVDFPAPLAPIKVTISPSLTSRSTPLRAITRP